MKRLFKNALVVALTMCGSTLNAQISITDLDTDYNQNFNSLSPTYLDNSYELLPEGWLAKEYGSNANEEYRAESGELAGGDLYSFGDAFGPDSLERAMGSIGSGSLYAVHYGIPFVNETEETISSVNISYRGELWRVGNADRGTGQDTLHFFYGVNKGEIFAEGYTSLPVLNFVSPAAPGDPRNQESVDGNAPGQFTLIEASFDVTIAPSDTLWIKWFDHNSSSYDDGLAVDDLTVSFSAIEAPISLFGEIALFDTYYTEDFNSLSNEYGLELGFETLPTAWFAEENGANANTTYRVAFGDYAGGNMYSFGDSVSTDRALGSIGSGSLNKSTYGSAWINTTGEVIENVEINFTGEMWRQGRPLRATGPDTLHFDFAINAEGIGADGFTAYDLLSFYSPVEDGTLNVPTDGNEPVYQTEISGVIGSLSLMPNDTLWVRWTDYNSSSYDDGLAIDDFSIAAINTADILTVSFQHPTTVVNEEGGVIAVPIVLANGNEFLSQVDVNLHDAGTIDLETDVNLVSSVVSFTEGAEFDTAFFYFELINSEPFESDEYFVLSLSNPSNAFLGEVILDTVRIINYEYPTTPIASLRPVDEDGVAEALGTNVKINGIVHGINFNYTGGFDFYLLEEDGGINVYSATELLGYSPQEGDELNVWGKVNQFKGLTRIESIDSIEVVSMDNDLFFADNIELATEVTESQYVTADSLKLYPAIATWPANLTVGAVNLATLDTVSLYISSNSELAGEEAPSGPFKVFAIGSQNSSSTDAPFNDGYRLMVIETESMSFASIKNIVSVEMSAYPNPTAGEVTIKGIQTGSTYQLSHLNGQVITDGTNLTDTTIQLDLSELAAGLYFLSIQNEGAIQTLKIIKK